MYVRVCGGRVRIHVFACNAVLVCTCIFGVGMVPAQPYLHRILLFWMTCCGLFQVSHSVQEEISVWPTVSLCGFSMLSNTSCACGTNVLLSIGLLCTVYFPLYPFAV